jgi:hypothetical protein
VLAAVPGASVPNHRAAAPPLEVVGLATPAAVPAPALHLKRTVHNRASDVRSWAPPVRVLDQRVALPAVAVVCGHEAGLDVRHEVLTEEAIRSLLAHIGLCILWQYL